MKLLATGLLHPARILRNGFAHDPAQLVYLERALALHDDLLAGRPVEVRDPTQPPPGAILQPTMKDLHEWARGPLRAGVVVDVEDIGVLLGVGLTRVADLVHLWVPIRRGAELYWPADRLPTVVAWLDAILSDPTIGKWFHNVMADVPWLRKWGFRVEGVAGDTMMMHHVAWPELPKGLQVLATLYSEAPNWKHLMQEREEEK